MNVALMILLSLGAGGKHPPLSHNPNLSRSLIWPNMPPPPSKVIVAIPVVPYYGYPWYKYSHCHPYCLPPHWTYKGFSFRPEVRPARGVLPNEQEILNGLQSRLDEAKKRWKEAPPELKSQYYKDYLAVKEEVEEVRAEIGKKLRGQYSQ